MKHSAVTFSILAMGIAALGTHLSAAPISYTFTGVGSGSLNGVSFAPSDFTIVGISDTTDVQNEISFLNVVNISASIDISGLGTFDIESATREFLSGEVVGFSRGPNGDDLYDGPSNIALEGWSMQTAIGPISGSGSLIQWSENPDIETNGGQLIFDTGSSDVTFQASLGSSTSSVPDNAPTMIMVASAVLALGVFRRRLAA
jgi:hypothetical protein